MADNRFRYNYFGPQGVHRNVFEEHHFRVALQVNLRYQLRDVMNPFAVSNLEFRALYRLPQHLALPLAGVLAPFMVEGSSHHYIPLEIKVLSALSFYATGSYQRGIGRSSDLAVSQSMMSNCLNEVTQALNQPEILLEFIHFPSPREEREAVIEVNNRCGMPRRVPRVLGYADGTLIRIVRPPLNENQQAYYCGKGCTALIVHIVCDADLRILSVNAQYPGSCTDPFIYRYSGLRREMITAYAESRCWLLGDSAYPQEPWMHTPILNAERGTPAYYYTQTHCGGRNHIERLNGVLKNRWRCLLWDRTLHYKPIKAGQIVNACAGNVTKFSQAQLISCYCLCCRRNYVPTTAKLGILISFSLLPSSSAVLHNFCKRFHLPDPPPVMENHDARLDDGYGDPDIDEQPAALRLLAQQERQYLIDFVYAERAGM